MKKTNKLISILLVAAMLLSMAPLSLTAFAATPTPYDGVPVTPQKISSSNYEKLGLTDANWSQFNGYYAIRNAKELYGFASIVKGQFDTAGINGVLLQDIVINTAGSTTYKWIPLADTFNHYMYTFDGNGHYISGIYCTDIIDGGSSYTYTGFIGCLQDGTVKNLIIKNSTFSSAARFVGAVVARNASGLITNCCVENTVSVSTSNSSDGVDYAGGVTGLNYGTVTNCVSFASVTGGYYNGPVIGNNNYGTGSNNYSSTGTHTCTNISVEHKEVKATCEYPGLSNYKYCLVCNNVTSSTKTETPATGHNWQAATCTEPQTCSSCGETQGDALGHKNLRFTIDTSNARKAEYRCEVCGVVGTVTLSVESVDYDGTPHGATITYTGDVPEVTVSYRNGDTGVTSTEVPVEAGRYYVSVPAGAFSLSGMFLIYKRAIDNITAPTPNTFIYDGEAHALISAGETSIGTMVYSLDGEEYSEEIPQGTNAGDYIVYYKVIGDKNHKNTEPATVTATIGKKPVTVTAADASKTYGEAEPEYFSFSYNLLYSEHKLNGQPARTPGENVGVYEIGQGTITQENNPNYDITFVSGKFTIEPDASGIEGLTIDNVKSSDKASIEYVLGQVENAETDLADTDKRAEWNLIKDNCVEMLKMIESVANHLESYKNEVAGYNIDTVTTDDYDYLESLSESEGQWLHDFAENYTDEEIKEFSNVNAALTKLLIRISDVTDEIVRIETAINDYDTEAVKSSDKADLEQLVADIKELTDGQNITADERAKLENLDATADALLAKIAETTAEYNRVIAVANGYDEATVTSADKDALVQLNEDIYALALTDNVTAEELENLENAHDKVLALIDKIADISDEIKRIIEAVDKYVFESVKSDDKADIEQLIEDIKALTDTQNITADERTLLETADENCDKLLEIIAATAAEINRIADATDAYDIDTVTSDDKADVEKLIADIKVLTDGDNINDTERNQLNGNDATLDALLERINETAAEFERINNEVDSYDVDSVKSPDREAVEQLKEDIEALKATDNVTEEEKAVLEEKLEKVNGLISRITQIEEQLEKITEIENGYNSETVTSDDKATIEETIAEIEAVNPDNLTDEQKAEYDEIKAGFEALLEEIAAAQAEVEAIGAELEMFDEKRVTIFWEEEIEALKARIDELLADDNMGEAEKAKLEEYKAQCDNLIEIINNPWKYFSLRFFYFIWDCLTWKYNGILWLFSKIFAF